MYQFIILVIIPNIMYGAFPWYDITKSFEEICQLPIPHELILKSQYPIVAESSCISFLGYTIKSPYGVPACALMTSRGIAIASHFGFSVLTYKTIRSHQHKSYDPPNIWFVACNKQITQSDILQTFSASDRPPEEFDAIAIANSFGNAAMELAWVQQDIAKARSLLAEGQVLVVSVFGDGNDMQEVCADFAKTAYIAWQSGAQIIELNLSCPNLNGHLFYKNSEIVHALVTAVHNSVPIPIMIKVGVFDNKHEMSNIFKAAAHAGAHAVCGINSVPIKVVHKDTGVPIFDTKRVVSGLSGAPIYSLAKQFVQDAVEIIAEEKLDLVVCATGGITKIEQFQEFLDAGAVIAMSATGFMSNPYAILKKTIKNSTNFS